MAGGVVGGANVPAARALLLACITGAVLALGGCKSESDSVLNDTAQSVQFDLHSGETCSSASGLLEPGQRLVLRCAFTQVTAFSYKPRSSGPCLISGDQVRRLARKSAVVGIFTREPRELPLSSVPCPSAP